MPIRFRCHHCNQLMGIARRKAGMTVSCPNCHTQLVVPRAEAEAKPEPPAAPVPPPANAAPAPLFERSDFEDFLQNPVNESPPPRADAPVPPPPFAVEIPPPPPLAPPPEIPPSPPAGLVLSPTQATWLTVAAILLLALAFGVGLLVGHYWVG